jgi:hypothetical protein
VSDPTVRRCGLLLALAIPQHGREQAAYVLRGLLVTSSARLYSRPAAAGLTVPLR